MNLLHTILYDTISLVTIIDPIGTAMVMLSLVKIDEIKTVSKISTLTVFIASILTMLSGGFVLTLFGINLFSLKAMGGIILLLVALNMVTGKEIAPTKSSKEENLAAKAKDNIAVIPLGIPLIFGPGAITAIIVLKTTAATYYDKLALFISLIIVSLIVFFSLRYSLYLSKLLGIHGTRIITRIMGLIIGSIALQFLVSGVKGLWIG